MSTLYITNIDDDPNTSYPTNTHEKGLSDKNPEEDKKIETYVRKGIVKQRNYVLNDVAALKKKMRAEGKKHEVSIGKEAKDASNISIPMKASFFEFVKANFINDLADNVNIVKVDNAEGIKAATDNYGDAFVEYLMEITFKANKHVHCVKLTAYTTTSQLFFQPVGEKPGLKEHLGQKGTPRFFVENFLLPWCSKAISEKRYNEEIANKYITALKEEIRKLDIMKLDQKKAAKNVTIEGVSEDLGTKSDAKCAAKVCNFQGINPQNKAAVGVCAKCGNVEHFACVKIKTDHKDDIIRGVQKYFCSTCFTKNPSLTLSDTSEPIKSRNRLGSIPIMGQGYLRITHATTAKPALSDHNLELRKCDNCEFETSNLQELRTHIDTVHKPACDKCQKTFETSEDLSQHIEMEHNFQCNNCNISLNNKKSLDEHIKNTHEHICQHCPTHTSVFTSEEDLKQHIEDEHTVSILNINNPCPHCEESFPDKNEVEAHVVEKHRFPCKHCEMVTTTSSDLEEHTQSTHSFHCVTCNKSFTTEKECSTHKKTVHSNTSSFECFLCETVYISKEQIQKHVEQEHMYECETCSNTFKTKTLLKEHLSDTNHMQSVQPIKCTFCNDEFMNQENLKKHIKDMHTFDCESCMYTGIGEEVMEDHILETHAKPDSNEMYSCDECTFKTQDKSCFGTHFKSTHGSKSKSKDRNLQKEASLESELRQLKNNLGRLEAMYHEALEENNNIKSEYEAKLMTANDNLTITKAENEALTEKVDILFKLGRSYLDKSKNEDNKHEKTGEIIEINDEQTDVSIESLENWTKKKLRGFKRSNPTAAAEKSMQTNLINQDPNKQLASSSGIRSPTSLSSPTAIPGSPSVPQATRHETQQSEKRNENLREKFCHYFVNTGKCDFEERTGSKCKFLHKQAPMCRSGLSCNRHKCMFSHPNINGSNSFLGHSRQYPLPMNPWQIGQVMNPWTIQQPNQLIQNPWNLNQLNPTQNTWNSQRTMRNYYQ